MFEKVSKSSPFALFRISKFGQNIVSPIKNMYIFGRAMDKEEKSEVINEANKIYDVENVIPSIYLVSELSRNKI